ncbi:MAG TPA: cysteine desulfurase-like protein [Gaiellaceae bacterium]|nr:cysteine desulfurase-like protein [Gaiellaceae bacterium]
MTSLHGEDGEVVDVTIEAVLDRFHTLNVPLAFFDGPAGTQVPDSVLEAVSGYMLAANANVGGKFLTSMVTDDVVGAARAAASDLLGVRTDELIFGANMTTLNFALSRTAARDWQAGDEVVATKLDHDANISPWLELAEDKGIVVKLADLDAECRIDLGHLRSLVTDRTKVVAFPMASNAVGTITPVEEIVKIAHDAGALAWVDAVHYAPHGDIEIPELGCDVLLCSPYKFYGPHLGLAWARRDLLEGWRPYKVRPQSEAPGKRHETGTLPHELLCGFVATVEYLHGVGWGFITRHEEMLGQRFLDGIPEGWKLHGPPTMEGRVSTFALSPPGGESPEEAATRLGAAGFAVWHGNNYAVEVFKHLGLPEGAVRVGIVHTNTEDQVDRLLAALPRG